MARPSNPRSTAGAILSDAVGVVVDRQTYRNLAYLLLAFPLGMIYFVVLTVGFSLGVALSVVLVGVGILVATVIGLRHVADFERRLSNRLLGTTIAAPDDVDDHDDVPSAVRAYLGAASTWRGLGYVMGKFWIGVLSFVLLLSTLGVAVELLFLPVFPGGVLNVEINSVEIAETVTTTTERALAVPAGAVLGVVALHLVNVFAGVNAWIAEALLGQSSSA